MMKINKDYLVTDTKKHGGKRKKPVRVLIPHHNAGISTGLDLAKYMKSTTRQLSATYVIGQEGEIFQTLDESLEPYTTGNRAIDTEAITFEIVNSKGAPTWEVSDKAFKSLVELSIDIAKRYDIKEVKYTGDKKGSIQLHKWYQNTNCPGPYLEAKMPEYASLVNEGLGVKIEPEKPKPVKPKPIKKTIAQLADEVNAGKWGNGKARFDGLTKAGYDAQAVQDEVNRRLGIKVDKPAPVKPKPVEPKPRGKWQFKLDHDVRIRNGKNGINGKDSGLVYRNGMSVNYDSVYTKDGYTFASYISNSGVRRSVAIGKGNTLWGKNV